MLGRLHVIPPLFSKVETEFGTAQDSARDLAEHFGVWLKCGVKKNFLCVFHKMSLLYALTEFLFRARLQISPEQRANRSSKIFVGLMLS